MTKGTPFVSRTGFRGVYTNKRSFRSSALVDDRLYHISARPIPLEAALDHDCVMFLLSDGQAEVNFPDLPREAHLERLASIPLAPRIREVLLTRGLLVA